MQLQDDKGNRQSIEKEIEYLTYQFASVLSALVASPIPITESLMLEPLLVRIVDTAPILKGLGAAVNDELKRIREILENDAEDNIGFAPIRYVFFATLAALSARIKTPNSDENLWARALIRHEWARRALSSNGYPSDDRLSVQSERAARTIKKEIAWDALAHLIAAEIGSVRQSNEAADANITKMKVTEFTTIVSEIAEALGRPGLETEIMATLTTSATSATSQAKDARASLDASETVRLLNTVVERLGPEGIGTALQLFVGLAKDPAVFDRVYPIVRKFLLGDNVTPILKSNVLRWFGEQAKLVNRPDAGFALIGKEPSPWEFQLPDSTRVTLWNERANLMRLAGDLETAREIYEQVLNISPIQQ